MELRKKMLEMLESTCVEENYEITGNLLIQVALAAMNNSNVYIVAENDLHTYVRLFKSWNLHVHKVVCSLPKDFQKVDDVEIIQPQDLLADETPRKFFFLFMPHCNSADMKNFFSEQLGNVPSAEMPIHTFIVDGNNKRLMDLNMNEKFDSNSMLYYQSHKKELMELFDSLADETSKRALYHYIESYVRNCIYSGEQNPTRWKYFFGGKYERLYKHLDGECWINCGAFVGDTIFSYLSWNFNPKKIYAFEASNKTYATMLKNLALLPPEKRELVEPINQLINEKTDFEKILAGNKCTLLNADIEGAELNLLKSMEKIIRADRPVIAICVYHLKEDILNVPQFLQSICKNYIYYIRKYTNYLGRLKRNGELVLYAVPVERSISFAPPPVNLLILAINCRVRDKKFSSDIIAALCFAVNFFRSEVYGSKIYKRWRKSRLAARLHFGGLASRHQSFE